MLTKKNIGNVGLYMLASNFAQFANTITAVALRFIIPVEFFGVVSLVNAYRTNLSQLNSPICNIADVQIPLAGDQPDYVRSLEQESYFYVFWSSLLQVVALLACAFFYRDSSIMLLGFIAAAITLPFAEFLRYDRILLKAHRRFNVIFWASIYSTVLSVGVLVFMSFYFGGWGYVVGAFSAQVIGWFYFHRSAKRECNVTFSFRGNLKTVYPLILGFGLAYTGYRFLMNACVTLDRVILEAVSTTTILGLYSFSVNLSNLVRGLPRSLIGAILPIFLASSSGSTKELKQENVVLYQRIVLSFTFFLVIAASIVVEIAVPLFLPDYIPSIMASQILFLAVITQNASSPLVADCLSESRGNELLFGGGCAFLFLLPFSYFGGMHFAMNGVAIAVLTAFLVNFAVLSWRSRLVNGLILFFRGSIVVMAGGGLLISRWCFGWEISGCIAFVFTILFTLDFYQGVREYRMNRKLEI